MKNLLKFSCANFSRSIILVSFLLFCCEKTSSDQNNYQIGECDPISIFPWFESFENNGTNLPPCWSQQKEENGWDGKKWDVVHNNPHLPPNAHHGNYKMFISRDNPFSSVQAIDLSTPIFDLSNVNDPMLNFWQITRGPCEFRIFIKNSPKGNWTYLWGCARHITDWQKESIPLPNKSDYYQIMFLGRYYGGGYGELRLDDISITDGELSVCSNKMDK